MNINVRFNIALGLVFVFLANTLGPLPAYAQEFSLPAPGQMVALSPSFSPAVLKGIQLDAKNPFRFHFFVDKGDTNLSQEELKSESSKLIKYFLASLTIPEKDLWVNLSPYEKDRIVPQEFGQTEMGRDLLAEDYLLKQITASLIYPESQLGKEFWKKVYAQAQAKLGTTNIPINTFNKVWIVPEKAVVYENGGVAFVLENHLKVMLEQDYLSLAKHEGIQSGPVPAKDTNQLGSQIVREIVIPALTREVNEGKNFAQLRQVFYSLILATWYKKKIKDSILNKVYSNRNKIGGVNVSVGDKDKIYQEYLRAFKKGVFNYIQEDPDQLSGQTVPRKYFSGGIIGSPIIFPVNLISKRDYAQLGSIMKVDVDFALSSRISSNQAAITDAAMSGFDALFDTRAIEGQVSPGETLAAYYDSTGKEQIRDFGIPIDTTGLRVSTVNDFNNINRGPTTLIDGWPDEIISSKLLEEDFKTMTNRNIDDFLAGEYLLIVGPGKNYFGEAISFLKAAPRIKGVVVVDMDYRNFLENSKRFVDMPEKYRSKILLLRANITQVPKMVKNLGTGCFKVIFANRVFQSELFDAAYPNKFNEFMTHFLPGIQLMPALEAAHDLTSQDGVLIETMRGHTNKVFRLTGWKSIKEESTHDYFIKVPRILTTKDMFVEKFSEEVGKKLKDFYNSADRAMINNPEFERGVQSAHVNALHMVMEDLERKGFVSFHGFVWDKQAVQDVFGGHRVLSIGLESAGEGYPSLGPEYLENYNEVNYLHNLGIEAYGVDPLVKENGSMPEYFKHGVAQAIPYPSDYFDYILSFFLFDPSYFEPRNEKSGLRLNNSSEVQRQGNSSVMDTYRAVATEIHRVLRPGGRFIFVPMNDNLHFVQALEENGQFNVQRLGNDQNVKSYIAIKQTPSLTGDRAKEAEEGGQDGAMNALELVSTHSRNAPKITVNKVSLSWIMESLEEKSKRFLNVKFNYPKDQFFSTSVKFDNTRSFSPIEEWEADFNNISDLIQNSLEGRNRRDGAKNVEVNVQINSLQLIMTIQDDGPGITEEVIRTLNDRIATIAPKSTKPKLNKRNKFEGGGMGLIKCAILFIDNMGAKISLENRPIEKYGKKSGTTIRILFPITKDSAQLGQPADGAMKTLRLDVSTRSIFHGSRIFGTGMIEQLSGWDQNIEEILKNAHVQFNIQTLTQNLKGAYTFHRSINNFEHLGARKDVKVQEEFLEQMKKTVEHLRIVREEAQKAFALVDRDVLDKRIVGGEAIDHFFDHAVEETMMKIESRIDIAEGIPSKRKFRIKDLLDNLKKQGYWAPVDYQIEQGVEDTMIHGNLYSLQSAIRNLLINAGEAVKGPDGLVPPGMKTELHFDLVENELKISVRDRGPGIKNIGDLFKLDSTTKGEGHGLGLFEARLAVEDMNGTIQARNRTQHEGSGAEFTITLPIVDGAMTGTKGAMRDSRPTIDDGIKFHSINVSTQEDTEIVHKAAEIIGDVERFAEENNLNFAPSFSSGFKLRDSLSILLENVFQHEYYKKEQQILYYRIYKAAEPVKGIRLEIWGPGDQPFPKIFLDKRSNGVRFKWFDPDHRPWKSATAPLKVSQKGGGLRSGISTVFDYLEDIPGGWHIKIGWRIDVKSKEHIIAIHFPIDRAMIDANKGGIDLNPAQMSMQVKKQGEDFRFDFNGTEIDAAQVTGATFTIRTMTPVTDLPLILGLKKEEPEALAKA